MTDTHLYEQAFPAGEQSTEPEDIEGQSLYDRRAAKLVNLAKRTPTGDRESYGYRAGLVAQAIGIDPLTGELRYSTADVLGWAAYAVSLGAGPPRLSPKLIEDLLYLRRLPNAPFREAYLHLKQITIKDGRQWAPQHLAESVGLTKQELERLLGISPRIDSRQSHPTLQLFITYDQAILFSRLLNVNFHTAGI